MNRLSPPVGAPYGIPLKTLTWPSLRPRILPVFIVIGVVTVLSPRLVNVTPSPRGNISPAALKLANRAVAVRKERRSNSRQPIWSFLLLLISNLPRSSVARFSELSFNCALFRRRFQQSFHGPVLLIQKVGNQQVIAQVKARLTPVHLWSAGDEFASGTIVVKCRPLGDVVGIALANPLRQAIVPKPSYRADGQCMSDFMSDKVIECAISRNLIAGGRDQPVVFNNRLSEKHISGEGILVDTPDAVVPIKEEPLPPTGVAYESRVAFCR